MEPGITFAILSPGSWPYPLIPIFRLFVYHNHCFHPSLGLGRFGKPDLFFCKDGNIRMLREIVQKPGIRFQNRRVRSFTQVHKNVPKQELAMAQA
jgi:hypothetical protein